MTGMGNFSKPNKQALKCSKYLVKRSGFWKAVSKKVRSAPEQKARPSPLSTKAFISSSPATAAVASDNSLSRSQLTAFRALGRFSRIVATPFSFSSLMLVYSTGALQGALTFCG